MTLGRFRAHRSWAMEKTVEDSYGSRQLAARLLEIFGGSALLLCVCGIYGLLAYLVSQRTREMGLRIALGAQRSDVMRLVLRQAVWMLLTGSAIGLVLAYFSSRLLRTFLDGVEPHDPWTMAAVTLLLLGCSLGSAWLPARRAAAVDLIQAPGRNKIPELLEVAQSKRESKWRVFDRMQQVSARFAGMASWQVGGFREQCKFHASGSAAPVGD